MNPYHFKGTNVAILVPGKVIKFHTNSSQFEVVYLLRHRTPDCEWGLVSYDVKKRLQSSRDGSRVVSSNSASTYLYVNLGGDTRLPVGSYCFGKYETKIFWVGQLDKKLDMRYCCSI